MASVDLRTRTSADSETARYPCSSFRVSQRPPSTSGGRLSTNHLRSISAPMIAESPRAV